VPVFLFVRAAPGNSAFWGTIGGSLIGTVVVVLLMNVPVWPITCRRHLGRRACCIVFMLTQAIPVTLRTSAYSA
jgi:hypothetical protein